jgi:hypothetical protein
MLTNTSYGSSRFKVSFARQISLSVSNTRVSTDLQQKYGPMDSIKGTLFYCDRMLSACYTRSEGLVRHHVIWTASCIKPANMKRRVQLFAINWPLNTASHPLPVMEEAERASQPVWRWWKEMCKSGAQLVTVLRAFGQRQTVDEVWITED